MRNLLKYIIRACGRHFERVRFGLIGYLTITYFLFFILLSYILPFAASFIISDYIMRFSLQYHITSCAQSGCKILQIIIEISIIISMA